MYFLRGGGGMRAIQVLRIVFLLVASINIKYLLHGQHENNSSISLRLALFDSVGQERWVYRPFIKIAQSAGFYVDYISLDQLMDTPLQNLDLHAYHGAVFMIGSEFFGGLHQQSNVCKKMLQVMKLFAAQKNRLIGLVLPTAHVANPRAVNVLGAYAPLLSAIGLPIVHAPITSAPMMHQSKAHQPAKATYSVANKNNVLSFSHLGIQSFLNTANLFLTTPVERRSLAYHTTLNPPHHGFVWDCEAMQNRLVKENGNVYLLPVRHICSKEIENTLPYGICWKNLQTHNLVALFSPTALACAGISESFHFCPMSSALKKEILTVIQRMFCELKMLMTIEHRHSSHVVGLLKNQIIPVPFPKKLQALGKPIKYPKNHLHKIAWMEIAAFYDEDLPAQLDQQERAQALQERELRQNKLIDYIFKAGLDTLWISITPNIYYSPIAKMVKKEDRAKTKLLEQKFLDSLACFTKKLKQASASSGRVLPKLVVGFEVANNLYGSNTPKNFALDLYGNEYRDIPAPLEQSFWDQEIKVPLETFLKKWSDQRVSNGIPISGVMLDLEMYCRQKTGTFLTAMGFDALTFSRFKDHKRHMPQLQTLHERVNYLMQHCLSKKYFQFLEQQALRLGLSLKEFFVKKIPDCQIMCYTPNILSNWFYKGLCKGLARSKDKPLHLLTFNSEFGLHQRWFEKHNIPVSHAQVLLLSKIQTADDYKQVQEILQAHHGVWYNRFSRFVEKRDPQSWTSVEQSPMNEQETEKFFAHVRALK